MTCPQRLKINCSSNLSFWVPTSPFDREKLLPSRKIFPAPQILPPLWGYFKGLSIKEETNCGARECSCDIFCSSEGTNSCSGDQQRSETCNKSFTGRICKTLGSHWVRPSHSRGLIQSNQPKKVHVFSSVNFHRTTVTSVCDCLLPNAQRNVHFLLLKGRLVHHVLGLKAENTSAICPQEQNKIKSSFFPL